MRDWIRNISALLIMSLAINAIYIGFVLMDEGSFFGETNYFKAFLMSATFEVCLFTAVSIIVYFMYGLFKKMSKGLKEEKKRYGNKHRNNRNNR